MDWIVGAILYGTSSSAGSESSTTIQTGSVGKINSP